MADPNDREVPEVISGVSVPYYGGGPYGDAMEVTGPPTLVFHDDPYREFLPTDARSILIVLSPNHYNFIPNPAFREDTHGWEMTGFTPTLSSDSWTGQSVVVSGDKASLRYRDHVLDENGAAVEGAGYVYVGPRTDLTAMDWYDSARSGAKWTGSAYVKGGRQKDTAFTEIPARARIVMTAYGPTDGTKMRSAPDVSNTERPYLERVYGPWYTIPDDGKWHRIFAKTSSMDTDEDARVSFLGCWWIDVAIELENVAGTLVSSAMLDANELVSRMDAQYFDGGITENVDKDDFIWSEVDESGIPRANRCPSYYYYDRMRRVQWLIDNLRFSVPVDRPYQIFYGGLDRPHVVYWEDGLNQEVRNSFFNRESLVL